jgi:hypothetical protein
LLADGFGCREDTGIYRAGFANQSGPFELGLRNESYDFTQLALLRREIGSLNFPLTDPKATLMPNVGPLPPEETGRRHHIAENGRQQRP